MYCQRVVEWDQYSVTLSRTVERCKELNSILNIAHLFSVYPANREKTETQVETCGKDIAYISKNGLEIWQNWAFSFVSQPNHWRECIIKIIPYFQRKFSLLTYLALTLNVPNVNMHPTSKVSPMEVLLVKWQSSYSVWRTLQVQSLVCPFRRISAIKHCERSFLAWHPGKLLTIGVDNTDSVRLVLTW